MLRSILSLLLFVPLMTIAQNTSLKNSSFTLQSTDLKGQAGSDQVFNGFGCTGKNISPALNWENAPGDTKGFAVTMYDPDAPSGSGWWHWVVYNIPANTTSLPAGAGASEDGQLPSGALQGRNDFGTKAYGGPCPPEGHGPHRYIITVFALDTEKLEVPEDASPALIGFNLNDRALARASLMFYHER